MYHRSCESKYESERKAFIDKARPSMTKCLTSLLRCENDGFIVFSIAKSTASQNGSRSAGIILHIGAVQLADQTLGNIIPEMV